MPSAEQEYLESLWTDEEPVDANAVPILAKSPVFQRSLHGKGAHTQLGGDGSPALSTLRPRPTVAPVVPMWGSTSHEHGGGGTKDAEELRREFDDVIHNLEQRRADYDAAALGATKARDLEAKIEEELHALRDEEGLLLVKQPPAHERMHKVRQWAVSCEAALADQRELLEAKELEVEAAAARLRAAEAELDFLADARQALDMTLASEADARREVAKALAAREERAARGYVMKLEREAERLDELAVTQQQLKESHIQAAQEAAEKAQQWLKKGMERVKRNMAKGKEVVAAQNEARRTAVMGLKDNLSKVREEVAQKAALYRQLQKQKHEVQEKEFQDLIERGLNPYEIHRKKDMEAQVKRQRAALHDRIMARKIVIAEQLAKEEAVHQRQLEEKEKERQAAIQWQREMGRAAQEAKTDDYMRETTVNHSVLLDPTGRLPLDPSQAVVAKTNTFGSGRSSQALLDRMTQKHPDIKPKELLVPVKYRGAEEGDSDDESSEGSIDNGRPRPAMTERSGYTTGTGFTQGTGSQWHASDRDEDLGVRDKTKGGDWKQLETRKLTKLERSMLEAAKTRHKEGIAAPKSMMGKDFGGDAFITTPVVVEFKDFEVGQTYSQKVIITNRSYAKNTFRVLEVPPEYGSVLEASYSLPGHLATGVSADVILTFTPKANEDIFTHVDMLAETGPFKIPIRCLTKKAALKTSTSAVNFGPGVILGESVTRTFSLINEGALEVEYSVIPVHLRHDLSLDDDSSEDQAPTATQSKPSSLRPGLGTSPAGTEPLEVLPFTIYQPHGMVHGYKQTHITVRFAPSAGVTSHQRLRIDYRVPGQKRLQVPPDIIDLEGIGRDVPVYLERSTINFRCVMVDHIYREKLIVRNGANTAMKVSVPNRPDVADYFEFSPNFGFVQAGEAFPITILFKPRTSILTQCARFFDDTESSGPVLKIPMKVTVPDQKLPVTFTLRARVTTTDLIFTPSKLDFGPCVMGEATGVVVRIKNPSALPQTFGCTNLPAGIGVFPNHGFGYILPGETIERIVTFQPPIPGPQNLNLTARTLAGRTFNLPATAFGVQPTLRLSHNKIEFPATPVNDETSISVALYSASSTPQAFEFGVPPKSGLRFYPHVGEVQPSSSVRIQIDYAPLPEEASDEEPEEEEEEQKPASPPAKSGTKSQQPSRPTSTASITTQKSKLSRSSKSKQGTMATLAEETEDQDKGSQQDRPGSPQLPEQDPNSWYRWQQHSIPCFIRPPNYSPEAVAIPGTAKRVAHNQSPGAPHTSPGSSNRGGDAGSAAQGESRADSDGNSVQALHLAVTTCAVQPDIVLRSDLNWIEDKRCYELDFGPVPVGQRVTRSIDLYNQGSDPAQLSSLPLDHRELFAVVNAWRLLKPGGKFRSLLAFTPQHRASYLQMLTVSSERTRIRLALKGQGISPELRLEPATLTTTGLDLGDVYKNESAQATFSVVNVCPFPLSFSMKFKGVPDYNLQNRPCFFCRPSEGTLAQGEKCEVTLVFRPSSQRPYFEDMLQVHVPNQHDQLVIPVKGRCWEEGLYVSGPEYPTLHEDPFMERQLAATAQEVLSAQMQQAAAASSAAASGATSAAGTGAKGKGGSKAGRPSSATGAAASAASAGAGLGPPSIIDPPPPLGVVAMAPSPRPMRRLVMKLKGHLYLGETATMVFEVGSLRSATHGASTGEVLLDEVPAADKAAGWSVDVQRMPLSAGDKKPITVRYTAPMEAHAGMAAFFGHAEAMELSIGATLKGCSPPPPTSEGRRVLLVFKITLQPGMRLAGDALPPGVTPVPAEGEGPPPPRPPRLAPQKR